MTQDWKKAQNKVQDALKLFESGRKDFWWKRFTDTYEAAGNIVQDQPSDLWFIYRGDFSLLEIKSSHYADKFYFKDIRNSQLIGARRVVASGGYSFFFIVKLPEWTWHWVPGVMVWDYINRGDKGMPWEDMNKIGRKLDFEALLPTLLEERQHANSSCCSR